MRISLDKSLIGLFPSFIKLYNYLTVFVTVLGLEIPVLKNAEYLEE